MAENKKPQNSSEEKKVEEKVHAQKAGSEKAHAEAGNEMHATDAADEFMEGADAVKAELSSLNEKMLRIAAEYENFRKRTMKEKEELAANAKAQMLLKIIPMYEEVELAAKEAENAVKNANKAESAEKGGLAANAAGNSKENAIAAGVKMLAAKFGKMLSDEGVTRMEVFGKKFDPYLHDVVSHVESEKPLGEIVQIVQNGYNLNGKVLRHAVVIVSNGKKEEKKNEEECEAGSCPSC